MKHEPIDLDRLAPLDRRRETDSVNGSKFAAGWTLAYYVEWLQREVTACGWTYPPGARDRDRVRSPEVVGYSDGRPVHTVTIVASGRYVHAYPDQDRP